MFRIRNYFKLEKSTTTLDGFATIGVLSEGYEFIVKDLAIHGKERQRWVSFPNKESDKINEKTGKKIFFPYVHFENNEEREAFQKDFFRELDMFIAAGCRFYEPDDQPKFPVKLKKDDEDCEIIPF